MNFFTNLPIDMGHPFILNFDAYFVNKIFENEWYEQTTLHPSISGGA